VGRISIGRHSMVSQYVCVMAGSHDASQPDLPLVVQDVVIGESAWVCAGAFLGPGVEVGAGAVVGARAVCFQNVPPRMVALGNPAKVVVPRRLTPLKA
jgi:putative colanic acid biosynthesis acetyltransferase WcaF